MAGIATFVGHLSVEVTVMRKKNIRMPQYYFHELRMDMIFLRSIDRVAFNRCAVTCGVRDGARREHKEKYNAFNDSDDS